jgi:hypothetical protein
MTDVNPENPQARHQELPAEEGAKRVQVNMPQETPEAQHGVRVRLSPEELEKMAETALFGPKSSDT